MHKLLYAYLFVLCCDAHSTHIKNEREKLIRNEALLTPGGTTILTDKEAAVNNCLMKHKFREIDYAFDNPQYFNFSQHYFTYKQNIRHSKVYKIIKDMPKGAGLHIHDMAVLGPDYLMNLTYMDHLYVCLQNNAVKFKFSMDVPKDECADKWQLMDNVRKSTENVTAFDEQLRKHFTLVVDDPDKVYPCIDDVWSAFMNYFGTVAPLLSYRPNWEQYFYDVLKQFREHNIMYVEVRSVLPNLYELDGTEYEPLITAKAYKKSITRFVNDYPDFIGAKLIYAPAREVNPTKVDEYLALANKIKSDMPNYFAGFDLVGQEDKGKPLLDFLPQLAGKDMNYFFHAGETNWYGCSTDMNLIDAVLLGAKRIGHAYALTKHPLVIQEVIKRDIGLEVNVISNEVLSLVKDMRNHPLSSFLAQGLPVVLSSDDPGVWEADPISEDFYVAFVGIASRLSDLRLLKALAINSLKYSTFNLDERNIVMDKFNSKWNEFVDNFNCSLY